MRIQDMALNQGGVTPIDSVLRSATVVKAGQDRISALTFDYIDI